MFEKTTVKKKNIVTGENYHLLYISNNIRVLTIETQNDEYYDELEDHLKAGWEILTAPISLGFSNLVRVILKKKDFRI